MNKLRLATAAALVCGLFAGSASAASVESTNDWWSVDFQSPTATGVALVEGQLGNLTNNAATAQVVQPYASGVWTALDGDESVITNGIVTNAVANTSATSTYLKLDTQGNDLTWAPTNTTTGVEISKALVDADLLLVGSDSAPATDDFDKNGDVQTAIYLKNEIDEDNGETTNSVLCVYSWDTVNRAQVWVELKNAANPELTDNSWHHIAVFVEYPTAGNPQVSVVVDETLMQDATGETHWTIANATSESLERKLTSVSLRGTGAVDNFTGKAITSTDTPYNFAADVYLDGAFQPEMSVTNYTADATTAFGNEEDGYFWFDDYSGGKATYRLAEIKFYNPSTDSWTTYEYEYDEDTNYITNPEECSNVTFLINENTEKLTGEFAVTASTAGATEDCTLVEIHYQTIGAYNALAVTDLAGAVSTNATLIVPSIFENGGTTNLVWTFPAVSGANVLSTLRVQNGATMTYADKTATVTKELTAALSADTAFVTATYAPGTLAEGADLDPGEAVDGLFTFTQYTPPVAIIVADSGATTNEYATLGAAVAAVQDGETVVLVSTIANESVHYTGTAAFTIDLNGQTWNYLDGETGNWAAFKNNGATVTFKDSSESGTGKIYCNGDGFCIWSRTGSVVIESGSFVNNSHEDYAIYIGTDDANFVGGVPPTITITGGTFVNEDNAPYNNKPAWSRLVLNVMNSNATTRTLVKTELIQVSGGSYSWDPALGDDNMGGSFVAEGYKSVYDDTTGLYNVVPDAEEFTITFVNGETTLYTTTAYEGQVPAYEGETPAKEATVQFTYTFAGWTNAVAGGPLYAGELPAAAGDTTYTAAFTETVNRYDVTFTVDGTTVATTNAPYGDTLYGPADPTKTAETGYTVAFAGWTNAVAGGAVVAAADLPAVNGEATWAAVFTTTAIEYTVTVALDGGTLASGDSIPATYTVETAAFTLPTPTKEGFTFQGWVDGEDNPVTQIAGGATGDISLTATWEEESGEVEVNPGDGLAQYKTDHPDATVPEPIEFTSDATPLCKIAFVAPAAGKYVLMTSTTVNGTYQAEGTPVEFAAGALVELTETTAGTTKFFKIGYEK